MTRQTDTIRVPLWAATVRAGVIAGMVLCGSTGWAQAPAPAPAPAPELQVDQPPAQPQPPAPPQQRNPGLIDTIGRWFDRGATTFRDQMQGVKERFDNLGDKAAADRRKFDDKAAEIGRDAADASRNAAKATKDAVEGVAKLPAARVMQGRERCSVAPNGAPDCVAAAEALCRKHGFGSGKSIDFTSAEECPTRVWLSGRQTGGECTTVTFISRAMCQ
jgi:hypothetical protein